MIANETVPRLASGCRLATAPGQDHMLLIPEGALQMRGPARTIVELCDGQRNVAGIIAELQGKFAPEDAARIESEVIEFLTRLQSRGVIEAA